MHKLCIKYSFGGLLARVFQQYVAQLVKSVVTGLCIVQDNAIIEKNIIPDSTLNQQFLSTRSKFLQRMLQKVEALFMVGIKNIRQECFVKHEFLEIPQNSQDIAYSFIKKDTLTQLPSCKFCEIFKNFFFYRTPAVAVSDQNNVSNLNLPHFIPLISFCSFG